MGISVAPAGAPRRQARRVRLAALLALVALAPACKGKSIEQREREAAEEISRSIHDVEAEALAQKVDPAVVKEVQEHLTAVHEYQGDVNGKLDSVTVNAIQAFQRTQGLTDDGIIDEKIRELLATAARQAKSSGG